MRHRALLLLGLCGWLGCGNSSKPAGDLKVTASPTGEFEAPLRLTLSFSKPMVAAAEIGKPVSSPPVSISPDFAKEARWSNDRTLLITPTKNLPISTLYKVTVPGSAKALDGSQPGNDVSFEVISARLMGEINVVGPKTYAAKDQLARISFTQDVPFEQVTKHCSYDAKDKHVAVKAAPSEPTALAKAYLVIPAGELAADTDWTISCATALRGSVGNLGTAEKLADAFHTFGPLRFVKLEPTANDIVPDEDLTLDLAFTTPLKEPYLLTIRPAVPGFPQRCHELGDETPGLSCAAQLEAQTSYTITIDAKQQDLFGQSLGTAQTLSIRTTDAKPTVSMDSGYFVAERKRPVLPVWTRNVKELQLRIIDVTPANFHELAPKLKWWEPESIDVTGTKLVARDSKLPIAGEKNQWGQRPIDPAALLGHKTGTGMYYVEVASEEVDKPPFADHGREKVLVNFTDLGVVSKLSAARGLVWVTQLSSGKPLAGASVSARDANGKVTWTGTTDAEGAAVLPGKDKLEGTGKRASHGEGEDGEEYEAERGEMHLFVQYQSDWTMVNPTRSGGLSPWAFNIDVDSSPGAAKLRGFMHTDRGLYQPGEKVHVKGLARVSKLGEPLAPPGEGKKVKVAVDGPQGSTFVETEARLSAFGGFWFDLELPGDARLGDYTIRAQLDSGTFTREFSVEEYRPATFEVTGKAKEGALVRQGKVQASVAANYLYGAPLRSGDVDVTVHSRPRRVEFDSFEGFSFFDERKYQAYYNGESEQSQTLVTEEHLKLDDKGNAAIAISIGANDVTADADLLVRANVAAPSNEVLGKTFVVPYFRSTRYFGIKSPGYFLDVGKPQRFEIIGVSPTGKPLDGPATVTVTRRDWNCVWEEWGYRGAYQCKDAVKTILATTLQLTAGKPAPLEFTPESGGDYWVVVEGPSGGSADTTAAAATELYAWGDGGGSWQSSDSMSFDIVTDKKQYRAGDTATLLLKTDLAQATGLVTIERDGVLERRLIEVTPKSKHLTVPITAAYAPNVYVSVALVQGRSGDGPRGKPRMRMGMVNLSVRPQDNALTVSVETDQKDYRPGAPVTATVKVTDAAGAPVSAEVSLTAADEGVLSLIGFETPNPVPTFYAPWGLGVTTATQLEYLRDIPGPNLDRPATGGDSPGTLRSRFVATAVWTPGAVTNAAGLATVQFAAPDNLTAFRVMAVAADKGYRFGSSDKRFTVSKPLQLHQALPRFLSRGDELKGGVVVHNETGRAGTATVKLVTDARVKARGDLVRTVPIDKDARVAVLFDLTAVELGESTLTFSVTMNGEGDAVAFTLPVRDPSPQLTQRVGTATIKDATTIALTLPPNAAPGSTELVVSVDPDGLSGIDQGLRDLIHYPYGCLEQTTSKMIPMIAVRELAESLAIDGLTGDALESYVRAGITKIGRHQTAYGGFSLWPGGEAEAYYTAYALWGLHLAKQAGYRVDAKRISDGLAYLRDHADQPGEHPPYYDEAGELGAQAFGLYVRAVLGDKDPQTATTLLTKPQMPLYGKAFLARALAAGISAREPAVLRLVDELATAANAATKTEALLEEPGGYHGYMSSSLRTSSIVLAALVELDAKNAAIKPLVRTIMKHRRSSDYLDTQENLYSLLALTSYARSLPAKAPSVVATLDGQALFSGALSGKQRLRSVTVPLPRNGALLLTPSGELNYNIALHYRLLPQALKPEASGITLERSYLDAAGKPQTSFRVGDVVTVRITTKLPDDDEHLIVSEPLPAGFEALNSRFVTVGETAVANQPWGTFREMLDDRVNFASEWSYRGEFTYEFSMRAIAEGTFARPPTTAELMYKPEVHARAGLERIEVKAK
jgi:alpha-2-macroglobulin